MSDDSLKFRHQFSRPFALTAFLGLPLGFLVALAVVGKGLVTTRAGLSAIFVGLAGGVVVATMFTVAWTSLCKVRVTPLGIRCYNAWGRYRFVAWADIDRVLPITFFGLRYIRVWSPGVPSPMWVPLFLSDMRGFQSAIIHHAGAENILSRCLAENGA